MAVTDVSTPLPELVLPPKATITVTLDDPAAIITQLNVYGFTPSGEHFTETITVPPLFAYGPDAV